MDTTSTIQEQQAQLFESTFEDHDMPDGVMVTDDNNPSRIDGDLEFVIVTPHMS